MRKLIFFTVILVTLCFHMSWASENVETISNTGPYEMKNVDTPPRVIKAFPPRYPFSAKVKNIEGRVVVRFVVTTEGTAREIEVIAGDPEGIFEKSAIEAVKQYKFNPGMKDGKPVDIIVKLPIVFELDDGNLTDFYNKTLQNSQRQIEKGYYEGAIDNLTTAINIYKKHSPAFYLRGFAYRATGEYKKALSDFNRAIKLDSEEPVYYDERGVVYSLLEDYIYSVIRAMLL